jgi:hypothetical protein
MTDKKVEVEKSNSRSRLLGRFQHNNPVVMRRLEEIRGFVELGLRFETVGISSSFVGSKRPFRNAEEIGG